MNVTKNDPKMRQFNGLAKQIIAWLGRQSLFQTFEDGVEVDVEEIRELLDEDDVKLDL